MKVLRLGGDMIFGYLTRQADKSREEIERQRRGIGEGVGRVVSEEEVKAGFSVFEGIDVNKDGEISREELEVRGEGVLEVFGEDFDVDAFLEKHGRKEGGRRSSALPLARRNLSLRPCSLRSPSGRNRAFLPPGGRG